jgi:hypothetical protein
VRWHEDADPNPAVRPANRRLKVTQLGKKVVQGYYKKLFDEVVGPRYRNSEPPPDRISRSNCGKWRRTNT